MNPASFKQNPSIKASGLALALVLGFGVPAGTATAGFPVTDIGNMINHIMNQINTYSSKLQDATQYGKEIDRWRQQAKDMQNQLTSLTSLVNSFGMPPSSTGQLTKVDPGKIVRDRCGDGGSVMSNLLGSFSLNPDGDIAAQQNRLCGAITTMETYQYNESVDFINITLPQIEADLKQIESARNSNTDKSGVNSGLSVDATKFMTKYDAQFDSWQTRMGIYQRSVDGLKAQQRVLSTIALRGKRGTNVVGQFGKTMALKTALGQ